MARAPSACLIAPAECLVAPPRSASTVSEAEGIESLLLDFLAYLELERGLSRNTLEAYRCDLLQFGEFLDRRGLDATQASHGELAAFLSELRVAASTLARKIACLRSFYRHLRREGLIEHDPTADLRGPRKPQRLPRVLTREQVARLLEQPQGSKPLALRDRALLELMYACGLRASEAVGLELRATKVVIFGSPLAGTPVMVTAPLAALDLPLKVLVWADGDQTKVSYTSPGHLASRYGLSDPLAGRLAGIDVLTDAVVGA